MFLYHGDVSLSVCLLAHTWTALIQLYICLQYEIIILKIWNNLLTTSICLIIAGLADVNVIRIQDYLSKESHLFFNWIFTGLTNNQLPSSSSFFRLYGNPVCTNSTPARAARLCQPTSVTEAPSGQGSQVSINCSPCPTDKNYEYNPSSPLPCFCAVPLGVGFRLKSPGISDFRPYKEDFQKNLAHLLVLADYQIYMERYIWEVGPRLNMHLKLFPNNTNLFNTSEVVRLRHLLAGWEITLSNVFGPYELLNFTLGSYEDGMYNLLFHQRMPLWTNSWNVSHHMCKSFAKTKGYIVFIFNLIFLPYGIHREHDT